MMSSINIVIARALARSNLTIRQGRHCERSEAIFTMMYEVAAGTSSPRNDMIASSGFALLAMTK